MIGIDTNVLVRYLVRDDPRQTRVTTQVIMKECTRESPGFINRIVLCEPVWVLESAYGYSKEAIVNVLDKLMRTSQFKVEDAQSAWTSFRMYQERGKRTFQIACSGPPVVSAAVIRLLHSIMPQVSSMIFIYCHNLRRLFATTLSGLKPSRSAQTNSSGLIQASFHLRSRD